MEGIVLFVGIIGNIISILMFLSPLKTFGRIVRNKSTEEFNSIPYICTLLGSCLWTYYGLIKPGSYLVATVNGFGIFVETIYVALFLLFAASPQKRAMTILFVVLDVAFLATVLSITYFLLSGDAKINVIGYISSGLNIIMYASPLSAMKTVMTSKSVEFMPFLLSFFLFLNGGVWTFYAVLVQDWFLGVPNGIGFLFGTVQLVLFAIYRDSKPSKQYLPKDFEEGLLQTDPTLPTSTQTQSY